RAAVAEKSAHRFHELRQQEKIVLEKRIRRHVPVFRRHAQNDFDAALRRRMRADPPDFLVEDRFGDLAFLDVLDQAAVPPHEADVQLLFRLVPLAANHDAIAVAVRPGAGDDRRDQRLPKTADALEQVGNLFVFPSELGGVIHVLILAAAALPEVTAGRLDAFRGRLDDVQQSGPRNILFYLGDFRLDGFAGEDKRHKDDEIIDAPDALAAERNVVNRQGEMVAGFERHRFSLERGGRSKKTFYRAGSLLAAMASEKIA